MKRRMKFVKFQGCGNDFLIFDETRGRKTPDRARSKLARLLTDRHFHIGADGLMFLETASGCDCSMRLFEPAGNEADMCGNGIRCIAAYMMQKLGTKDVDILTRDGPKHITAIGDEYRVDMGKVRTERRDIQQYITDKGGPRDSMMSVSFTACGRRFRGSIVNSGEPHIVIHAEDLDSIDVAAVGDSMNANKKRFPKGVSINFVQVAGLHSINVRTYERGVYGETLACGTGATACVAVALMQGWVGQGEVKVRTRGGVLKIALTKDGRALMTGPATEVYSGSISVEI
jgi:diaminopimelate epimerase